MERPDMHQWLNSLDPASGYPIWIISHNRAGTAPFLNAMRDGSTNDPEVVDAFTRPDRVYVLVREEQRAAYEQAYPMMNIVALPGSLIPNAGSARAMAAQMARLEGHRRILMLDDDVFGLRFLARGSILSGKNAGTECSRPADLTDRKAVPNLPEKVLTALSHLAEEVFEQHPRVMMGGIIKRHMSFDHRNHRTKYKVNGGVTPRQITVWELDRMDAAGVDLDLDAFGVHGEDLGWVDSVLANDGDIFCVTSLTYDHWPESINIHKSMIRTPETARDLHREEEAALQVRPIWNYLRVKRDLVGDYEWGDVDWRKLAKYRGTPTEIVSWDEENAPATGPAEQLI